MSDMLVPSGEAAPSSGAPGPRLPRAGLVAGAVDPGLGRWLCALRRRTGATVTTLRLGGEPAGSPLVLDSRDDHRCDGAACDRATWARGCELVGQPAPPVGPPGETDRLEAPVELAGSVLGTVTAVAPGRSAWTSDDVRAVTEVAAALSVEIALRLARLEAELAEELLGSHARVHELIAGTAPLGEVLAAVVESIERHDPSVLATVVLLDPDTSTLHPGAGRSVPSAYLTAIDGVVIGPNVGSCGTAAWSGELVISEDLSTDPRWAPVRAIPLAAGLRSCWSMPIKASGGDVLGTLAFYGREPRRPHHDQLAVLRDWARVAGIAIERHRATEHLLREARFDGLTGLANRRATLEALEQATRRATPERPLAVLFLDLDGLKRLNDTLGHDRADELLREVARRLGATAPAGCAVGRFGGDEFVVVAEDVASRAGAETLALTLLEAVAAPLPGPEGLVVTASIGIAYGGDDALDARELLREADAAMYAAKRSGRDRCAFYEGGQRLRSGRRVSLQRSLRGAEARGELHLCFSPVVELGCGALVAVEVEPTWNSPTHGQVGPAELLAVAAEVGAVLPIGAWVLRESCEAVAHASRRAGRPLPLAVDVSRVQLEQPGFAHAVRQVVYHTGLDAEQLSLEVDEHDLAEPSARVRRTLDELAGLGVRLVVDHARGALCAPRDLCTLPLRSMKLEAAGTPRDDPRGEVLATALAHVAAAFGWSLGALGIASDDERLLLRRLGFASGQGPRFGPPIEATALTARWAAAVTVAGAAGAAG